MCCVKLCVKLNNRAHISTEQFAYLITGYLQAKELVNVSTQIYSSILKVNVLRIRMFLKLT